MTKEIKDPAGKIRLHLRRDQDEGTRQMTTKGRHHLCSVEKEDIAENPGNSNNNEVKPVFYDNCN